MRFIVDAQLPPALARWLVDRGEEAWHVVDLQLGSAPDSEIWARALSMDAVIITKDEDFAIRIQVATPAPAVIWVRYGNVRTPMLLTQLAVVWDRVADAVGRGERLVELV